MKPTTFISLASMISIVLLASCAGTDSAKSPGANSGSSVAGTKNPEVFTGTNGDDIIAGSKGDDILLGGKGDDTYIYRKGDGNDSIYDDEGFNSIRLTDMTAENVSGVYREGDNLIVNFKESAQNSKEAGSIEIKGYFSNPKSTFIIIFSDENVWDRKKVENNCQTVK